MNSCFWIGWFSAVVQRSEIKHVLPVENIFKAFLIKFFFSYVTWKLELDRNEFLKHLPFSLTALLALAGYLPKFKSKRKLVIQVFQQLPPHLSILPNHCLGKLGWDYCENKAAYKTSFLQFENWSSSHSEITQNPEKQALFITSSLTPSSIGLFLHFFIF